MLLPGALLDMLLFLCALRSFVPPLLLGTLWWLILSRPVLLLSALLLRCVAVGC